MTPVMLDTAVMILILLSTGIALLRGFVKEVLMVVNLVAAAGAAFAFGEMARPFFMETFGANADKPQDIWGVVPPAFMATFCAYASVFFGVLLVLSLAGMAISGGIKSLGLGPLDKALGAVFGAVRGVLIALLLYAPFAFAMEKENYPSWAKESASVGILDDLFHTARGYVDDTEDAPAAEEEEEPVDPDSLRGKLRRASDTISREVESHAAGELTADEKAE